MAYVYSELSACGCNYLGAWNRGFWLAAAARRAVMPAATIMVLRISAHLRLHNRALPRGILWYRILFSAKQHNR